MSNRISMNFKTKVKAREFNELLAGVVQPGVYENGSAALTKSISAGKVKVKAGTRLYVYSDADVDEAAGLSPICVNIVVSVDSADITVTQATPYVCASFTWQDNTDVANLGVTFSAQSRTNALTSSNNFVIIGQALYDATYTLLDKFDYSEQTTSLISQKYSAEFKPSIYSVLDSGFFLKNKIYFSTGSAYVDGTVVNWAGGAFTLSYGLTTTGQERKDLITIDSSGALGQVLGTAVINPLVPATPVYPTDKVVIAVVHRKYAQGDVIYPEDITQIEQARSSRIDTDKSKYIYTAGATGGSVGNTTQNRLDYVHSSNKSVYDFFPVGSVIMFDGSWTDNVTLPGWYACTGAYGTPNLVSKFVRGGSSNGATGGADTATLSITNLPQHTHAITDGGHSHVVQIYHRTQADSHNHSLFTRAIASGTPSEGLFQSYYNSSSYIAVAGTVSTDGRYYYSLGVTGQYEPRVGGSGWYEHDHQLNFSATSNTSVTSISISAGEGCGGNPFSILPTYYTMIYIKKMVYTA